MLMVCSKLGCTGHKNYMRSKHKVYTVGTGSFLGVKSGRSVTLTPHPLLVLWSWKSRAIPLLPLWAVRPVQNLSACTRVHFSFLHSCECTIAQVVSCQPLAMEALVLFQPVHMRVVIDKVAVGQVFLQEFKVLPVTSIIPLVLHSSSS